VSHIVSVCKDPVPADWPESGQQQLRIPVDDVDHEDLLIWMPRACEFIHTALSEGGTVLIHSERGQSRSATIAAAYGE
jgi:dual specificity phosphatase 12